MANHTNWLNISTMSGSSGQTILTLTANTNYDNTDKVAIVKAYNPVYNISATTTVRLSAYTPYIYVNPSIIGVPGSGGTYQFAISANCGYVIAYPDMVSSYSTSAGTGNSNITFSVSGTSASTTVIGNIVITDTSGQYSTTLRIEQYGEGVQITYSPTAVTIPFSGGSATFTVTANCVYDIVKGTGDWYTVSPQSGYTGATTFTVSSNTVNGGNSGWTSNITISCPTGTVGTVGVTEESAGQYRIDYTADTSNVAASGETRTITIDASDLIASSVSVTIQGAQGATYSYDSANGVITLNIPDNSGSSREISVAVTGTRQSTSNQANAVITYTQEAHTVYPLPYTADTSIVDASGETRTITIDASNLVASSITIGIEGATGVTYSYTNGVITIYFPQNTGLPKEITVNVTGKTTDGDLGSATITYEQEGYFSPGETRLIAIYNVTTSSGNTKILNGTPATFSFAELQDGTNVPIAENYVFPATGLQAVFYTLTGNSIDAGTFGGCRDLVSVRIPSQVTTLGYGSFMRTGLSYFVIPDSVKSIGYNTFSGCNYLESVTIGSGVTDFGNGFSGCTNITAATIADGLVALGLAGDVYSDISVRGGYVFADCKKLIYISLPNSLKVIGDGCFAGCKAFTTFNIPSSVTTIGYNCFGNTNLTAITIPDSVISLGGNCFYQCYSLGSVVIGTGVTELYGTFQGCTALSSITIPDTVVFIDRDCFYATYYLNNYCPTYGNIYYPNNVVAYRLVDAQSNSTTACTFKTGTKTIGESFAYNYNITLSNFELPNTLEYIGRWALYNLTNSNYTVPQSVKYIGPEAFNSSFLSNCTKYSGVYYPNSSIAYKATATTITSCVISSGTKYIAEECFTYCSNLTAVTIANTVVSIGQGPNGYLSFYNRQGAFAYCESLSTIEIPNSVTGIGAKCFYSGTSLSSVTLGTGLKVIGPSAFARCTSLQSVSSYSFVPPAVCNTAFQGVRQNGTLYYPIGSNYSSWLSNEADFLGYRNWTGQTF